MLPLFVIGCGAEIDLEEESYLRRSQTILVTTPIADTISTIEQLSLSGLLAKEWNVNTYDGLGRELQLEVYNFKELSSDISDGELGYLRKYIYANNNDPLPTTEEGKAWDVWSENSTGEVTHQSTLIHSNPQLEQPSSTHTSSTRYTDGIPTQYTQTISNYLFNSLDLLESIEVIDELAGGSFSVSQNFNWSETTKLLDSYSNLELNTSQSFYYHNGALDQIQFYSRGELSHIKTFRYKIINDAYLIISSLSFLSSNIEYTLVAIFEEMPCPQSTINKARYHTPEWQLCIKKSYWNE